MNYPTYHWKSTITKTPFYIIFYFVYCFDLQTDDGDQSGGDGEGGIISFFFPLAEKHQLLEQQLTMAKKKSTGTHAGTLQKKGKWMMKKKKMRMEGL